MFAKNLLAALALAVSGSAFAAGDHAHGDDHKPQHGGIVAATHDMDYELVAKPDVITLHLRDHGKPASSQGVSAKLTLLNGTEKSEAVLVPAGDGKLEAKVLEVLQSEQGPHPVCKACDGERKDKPVEGMVIMWDVEKDGDVWDGGRILDPKNGKTYKVKLTMMDGGQKLDVHGYIGFALLGRSQVWERKSP